MKTKMVMAEDGEEITILSPDTWEEAAGVISGSSVHTFNEFGHGREDDLEKTDWTLSKDTTPGYDLEALFKVDPFEHGPIFSLDLIRKLISRGLWHDDYEGLTDYGSQVINKVLTDSVLEGTISPGKIAGRIMSALPGVSEAQAETIARTEIARFSNIGRVAEWEEEPDAHKYKYDWIGPRYEEGRSTQACENIKKRTEGGVPLTSLLSIVREESLRWAQENGISSWTYQDDLLPHFNCRHRPFRTGRL